MNSASEVILFSGILIAVLVVAALVKKEPGDYLRLFLFCGIAAVTTVTTLYLVIDTVAQNQSSVSGGPVHWHADYELFVCGRAAAGSDSHVKGAILAHANEEVDLRDPGGISNRIGSSDFHEHGDNRIHVEGVVENLHDVNLQNFFRTVGGELTMDTLRVPTEEGMLETQNGQPCADGTRGALQVFLYKTTGQTVTQEKLANFPEYVLSPYGTVPPGDCLIIEFGPAKERTDKTCNFYDITIKKGELQRGY